MAALEADSGWQSISLFPKYELSYRKVGLFVTLVGGWASKTHVAQDVVWGTLPEGCRPSWYHTVANAYVYTEGGYVDIDASGTVIFRLPSGEANYFYFLTTFPVA